jgi:hypothetical protein
VVPRAFASSRRTKAAAFFQCDSFAQIDLSPEFLNAEQIAAKLAIRQSVTGFQVIRQVIRFSTLENG